MTQEPALLSGPERREHLYDWPTLGDHRDHLGRVHGVSAEQMVGKDRWMLGDLHAGFHDA